MQIGELNRRINILESQEINDSFGAVTSEWITTGKVWAKIVPGRGSEQLDNQQVKAEQNVTITVRYYPSLTVKHRVGYLDKVYEILAVSDKYTEHRWTEITCREVFDNG